MNDELILRRKRQNADRVRAFIKRKMDLDANSATSKLLHKNRLNTDSCRRYRQKFKQLKTDEVDSKAPGVLEVEHGVVFAPEVLQQALPHVASIVQGAMLEPIGLSKTAAPKPSNQSSKQCTHKDQVHTQPDPGQSKILNMFPCNFCKLRFPSRMTLNKHRALHFQRKKKRCSCTNCLRLDSTNGSFPPKSHIEPKNKEFLCSICDVTCSTLAGLTKHNMAHHVAPLHACKVCNRDFDSAFELECHSKTHNASVKTYSRARKVQKHAKPVNVNTDINVRERSEDSTSIKSDTRASEVPKLDIAIETVKEEKIGNDENSNEELLELYADHEVKEEMVLGPVVLLRRNDEFGVQTRRETNQTGTFDSTEVENMTAEYADHEVKEEMLLGPEVLLRRNDEFGVQTKRETNQTGTFDSTEVENMTAEYADHKVKEEMLLGPEVLLRRNDEFRVQTKRETNQTGTLDSTEVENMTANVKDEPDEKCKASPIEAQSVDLHAKHDAVGQINFLSSKYGKSRRQEPLPHTPGGHLPLYSAIKYAGDLAFVALIPAGERSGQRVNKSLTNTTRSNKNKPNKNNLGSVMPQSRHVAFRKDKEEQVSNATHAKENTPETVAVKVESGSNDIGKAEQALAEHDIKDDLVLGL